MFWGTALGTSAIAVLLLVSSLRYANNPASVIPDSLADTGVLLEENRASLVTPTHVGALSQPLAGGAAPVHIGNLTAASARASGVPSAQAGVKPGAPGGAEVTSALRRVMGALRIRVANMPGRLGRQAARPQSKLAQRLSRGKGQCAIAGEDCLPTKCCANPNLVCFKKTARWATCLSECRRGLHHDDPPKFREPWSCQVVRRPVGSPLPALFCFMAVRSTGNEAKLVRHQALIGAGIFACDRHAVFSDRAVRLTNAVATRPLKNFTARLGVAGALTATWVNTAGFEEAWAAVAETKGIWDHDWVVKVDPDTVFFPMRLAMLLHRSASSLEAADRGAGVYLRNCAAPAPGALQLYGSIEVVSHRALGQLTNRGGRCEGPDLLRMGEDMWLQRCLDSLGATGVQRDDILRDGYCPVAGEKACTFGAVAFHPYKAVAQWNACRDTALKAPAKVVMKLK